MTVSIWDILSLCLGAATQYHHLGPRPAGHGHRRDSAAAAQGLTLVHISAQPEPVWFIEATASVHFSAQPDTFLPIKAPNIAHKNCSRQPEKWTRVVYKKRLR